MNIILSYILTSIIGMAVDGISLLMTSLIVVAFMISWGFNRLSILRIRKNSQRIKDMSAIMRHTLNLNGDAVIKLSLAERYAINIHGDFLPEKGKQ